MAGPSESHGHRQVAAGVPALPPSMRDRVPFLLYRASQISQSLASEMLAEMDLDARQAGILTMVTELEPMTQKALADALRIDRTTMVTLLDDLEDKGYVVRQRHPRDRRAFLVHPTDSGRSAQAAAVRILDEQQRRFLAPLTPAERSQLAALLTRLHGRPAPGELRQNLVRVTVTDPHGVAHQAQFRVVGRASFPPGLGTGGLGTGAAITSRALIDAQCRPGAAWQACQRNVQRGAIYHVLARAAPGSAAALARHVSTYRQFTGSAQEPVELVNFGESVNFPLLLGGILALFGAATIVHLLVVSVSRRRAEAGLLKVLGFVRYQVAAVVSWQATTVALVGIAAGVPLGIVAGRVCWRVFATNFGVVPLTVVEALPVTVLAFGVLAAANVLAFFPALLAARSRPARLMRAE